MVLALAVALVLIAGVGCSPRDPLPAGLAGVGDLPVPASAWPAAGYDARHSSATTAVGPRTGTLSWRVDLGGNATPGPVIGVDGSVLAATNAGVLFALSPHDGHRLWSFDGGGGYGNDLTTSPSVLGDGTILWSGSRNTLFALDRSGHPRWRVEFTSMVLSPAIGGRDRVYVADMAGRLSALEITTAGHRVVWSVEVGGPDYASPTIGPDGTVFTASGHDLVAVRDLGDRAVVRWRPGWSWSGPTTTSSSASTGSRAPPASGARRSSTRRATTTSRPGRGGLRVRHRWGADVRR